MLRTFLFGGFRGAGCGAQAHRAFARRFRKQRRGVLCNWFEHSPAMQTPDFRSELNGVVEELRQQGLLQSRCQMHDYCMQHPDARIPDTWHADVYGFCFQTAQHRYFLRCFPHTGDYNFYLYCYVHPDRLMERSPNLKTASSGKTGQEHLPNSAAISRHMPDQANSSRPAATPKKNWSQSGNGCGGGSLP